MTGPRLPSYSKLQERMRGVHFLRRERFTDSVTHSMWVVARETLNQRKMCSVARCLLRAALPSSAKRRAAPCAIPCEKGMLSRSRPIFKYNGDFAFRDYPDTVSNSVRTGIPIIFGYDSTISGRGSFDLTYSLLIDPKVLKSPQPATLYCPPINSVGDGSSNCSENRPA